MPQFPPHHHHPCVSPSPRPRLFLLLFLLASTSSAFLFQIYSVTHEDEELAVVVDPNLSFENPRLPQAYIALQAWKSAIFSDPFNFKATWDGSAVCYMGAYCAPSRANASLTVAVGIDLNHADIAGYLPQELGLLADLALFHLNSNRFCGVVHNTLCRTRSRPELAEQQSLRGQVPALKFLDLRFNEFEGPVPSQLFDKDLEAGLGPGESWQMVRLGGPVPSNPSPTLNRGSSRAFTVPSGFCPPSSKLSWPEALQKEIISFGAPTFHWAKTRSAEESTGSTRSLPGPLGVRGLDGDQ
ncbi:leucine-rich repeat extensin-like protein 2 [Alnus glutinosa]|uniref:leucine-rich repeat extensin-like protein 2 n=1 Tax=Alnus glutinosa TaxID=3517 RepID=UPI002D786A51|nr:leucine-rich repeat extensin-like protein 2 [Alnus glutinosa]